jgi:membrane-associated phospholipid phosphatase
MKITSRIWVGIVLFVALEVTLFLFVDRPLSEHLRAVDVDYPDVVNFFRLITDFGKSKWYLWPSAIGVILCAGLMRMKFISMKGRVDLARIGNALMFIFTGVALSGIITDIIKPLLCRARPVLLQREQIYGFHPFTHGSMWESMPSGHATTVFALMTVLTILMPRGRWLWLFLTVLLGFSRFLVNAHYLSDIFAGAAVGVLTVLALRPFFNHDRIIPLRSWIFPIDR